MVHLVADFDTAEVLESEGDIDARFSPCSSFKLPLALMGFDSGILINENTPVWDYLPDYDPHSLVMLDQWKKPYTPALWMQNSCVWYSQQVTHRLGRDKFQRYVDAFHYGNRDISGDPGKNNALLRSWITSSLTISPREQVDFLRRMLAGRLPVSAEAVAKARTLAAAGDFIGGSLFGKTGSGYTDMTKGLQRGWYIGWLERRERKLLFAGLVDHSGAGFAGMQARALMKDVLERV
jgi:beta-lactamase class D